MTIGTVFSDDCAYRYTLERQLPAGASGTCLFVMLNPSTADAELNDPTIRRCIGFARDWGHDRLLVGNLFALRSTDPKQLMAVKDPVGPLNDYWLAEMKQQAAVTVCAWGAFPFAEQRARELAIKSKGSKAMALGVTKSGQPRHPLYLKKDLRPVEFQVKV